MGSLLSPVPPGLGIDQLDQDEGRLEQVKDQGSHVEGDVEFSVHSHHDEEQRQLNRQLEEPEECCAHRALANLSFGQIPVHRALERQIHHHPVQDEIDEAGSNPEAVAGDVVEVEEHRDQRGDDDEETAGHHCLNLRELRGLDLGSARHADQGGEANEHAGDLSDRDEKDYVLEQFPSPLGTVGFIKSDTIR